MKLVDMNAIKRKLEFMHCPKCNEKPSVTVSGDSFKINCCCDDFKRKLTKTAETEIAAQAKKGVEEQLKRMFK